MSTLGSTLLDLALAIADRRSVDWSHLGAHKPGRTAVLGNLERLARLERDARAGAAGDDAEEDAARAAGFEPFGWGHLEVRGQIGAGGFGEVYRAFDPILRREVALKLRRGSPGEGPAVGAAQLFIDEARRLARVRHPNVLAVHGADVHDGRVGLWADLVRGETLEARLAREGALATRGVLELALALARALAAVHAAELVHGDLKASNVMVEEDGRVVLMDFGAGSDLRAQAPGRPRYGSPLAMAPETLAGAAASPAGDLYALGALLFRLLTGAHVIEAENLDQLLERHGRGERRSWHGMKGRLPRSLRRLVDDLLAARPEARPSAEQTRACLLAIQGAPLRRRRRLVVAAIIASLAAGTVAATAGFFHARRAEQRALAAQAETEEVNDFLTEVLSAPRSTSQGPNVRVVDLLDLAAERAASDLAGSPALQARVFFLLGDTQTALELTDGAERNLLRAFELWRGHPGHDPELGPAIRAELGLLYQQTGRNPQALRQLTSAIAESEALGSSSRPQLYARIYRSRVYDALGDLTSARADLETAIALGPAVGRAGEYDARLAELDLAGILASTGENQHVEPLLRDVLAWWQHNVGERHNNTLLARQMLAGVLVRSGRPAEAEPLLRENLRISGEWLGGESSVHIADLIILEDALWTQGRREDSLATYERLIEVAARAHGTRAETYYAVRGNYASRLFEVGRVAEAERILRELMAAESSRPSRGQEGLYANRYNLAELLYKTGRFDEALGLIADCRLRMRETLGADHLFTLVADALAGACQIAVGKRREGEALLRQTLERQREILGADHPKTLETEAMLADLEKNF